MARSEIPAGMFLVIGILITVTSFSVLNFSQPSSPQAMQLFLGIGIIFTGIGGVKIFLKNKNKIREKEEQVAENFAQPKKVEIILCQVCQTKNYSTSNYCHMCGAKLQ